MCGPSQLQSLVLQSPDENAGVLPGGSSQCLASLSPVDSGSERASTPVSTMWDFSSKFLPLCLEEFCCPACRLLCVSWEEFMEARSLWLSSSLLKALPSCCSLGCQGSELAIQCPSCYCTQLCLHDLKWPPLRRHEKGKSPLSFRPAEGAVKSVRGRSGLSSVNFSLNGWWVFLHRPVMDRLFFKICFSFLVWEQHIYPL